jgi:hypothetical protein
VNRAGNRGRPAGAALQGTPHSGHDLARPWGQLFPAEQQRTVRLLVEKMIVSPCDIEVGLRWSGIEELALELRPAVTEEVAA